MQEIIKNMLFAELESKRQKAITTLHLLFNHPAGIGDHSTEDFYNNAMSALEALSDADDKIETLKKYSFSIENGKHITTKTAE